MVVPYAESIHLKHNKYIHIKAGVMMMVVVEEVWQECNWGTKQKSNWEHGNVMSGQKSWIGGGDGPKDLTL